MAEVKLGCGVYGVGSVFSVEIKRNAKVEALQKAIFDGQRYHERFSFPPSELTLYLAGKKEGGEIKWLKDDDDLDALLRGDVDKQYMKCVLRGFLTKTALGSTFSLDARTFTCWWNFRKQWLMLGNH
ncbi:hypothetical protein V7S43_013250 [Phytophthora oleae]|uniref:Crinkler effector protein N-terminal domain-containing protein n=1 Tax=Phytophthora oleae TaxID=2107226 RepID=A0ABD3F8X4_9STRA